MKRTWKTLCRILVVSVSLILLLTACTKKNDTDDNFFSDLASAWNTRQQVLSQAGQEFDSISNNEDLSEEEKTKQLSDNQSKAVKDAYVSEYENMKKYEDQLDNFKDENLKGEVSDYLTALKGCYDAVNQEFSIEANKSFNENYHKRVQALQALSDDSRFVIPKDQIDDLNTNEQALKDYEEENSKIQEAAQKFEEDINKLDFKVVSGPSNADPKAQLVMESPFTNNSGMNIENLTIKFSYVDKDGKEMDSDTFHADNFKNGETQTVRLDPSTVDYDHIEINIEEGLKFTDPE